MPLAEATPRACVVGNHPKAIPQASAYNIQHKYKGHLFHWAIEPLGCYFLTSARAVTSMGLGSNFWSRGHFRESGKHLRNTALWLVKKRSCDQSVTYHMLMTSRDTYSQYTFRLLPGLFVMVLHVVLTSMKSWTLIGPFRSRGLNTRFWLAVWWSDHYHYSPHPRGFGPSVKAYFFAHVRWLHSTFVYNTSCSCL